MLVVLVVPRTPALLLPLLTAPLLLVVVVLLPVILRLPVVAEERGCVLLLLLVVVVVLLLLLVVARRITLPLPLPLLLLLVAVVAVLLLPPLAGRVAGVVAVAVAGGRVGAATARRDVLDTTEEEPRLVVAAGRLVGGALRAERAERGEEAMVAAVSVAVAEDGRWLPRVEILARPPAASSCEGVMFAGPASGRCRCRA